MATPAMPHQTFLQCMLKHSFGNCDSLEVAIKCRSTCSLSGQHV